jgi:MFS superfamily sulfate permease-like transporter
MTELLSKPIRYGYMNGIALTVLISQLPKLLGFSIEASVRCATGAHRRGDPRRQGELDVVRHRRSARWSRSLPASVQAHSGIVIAVVAATIVVAIWNLDVTRECKVLGPLPQGLPSFALP